MAAAAAAAACVLCASVVLVVVLLWRRRNPSVPGFAGWCTIGLVGVRRMRPFF